MLTVAQLIKQLSLFNQDLPITIINNMGDPSKAQLNEIKQVTNVALKNQEGQENFVIVIVDELSRVVQPESTEKRDPEDQSKERFETITQSVK